MRKRNTYLWASLFTIIFLLSLDYWRWDTPITLGWLNLPVWMAYFVVIQLVLAFFIFLFTKYYWNEREE